MEKLTEFYKTTSCLLMGNEDADKAWVERKISQRESEMFDLEWMKNYTAVDPRDIQSECQIFIDKARKDIFLRAYKITNSSDIAAFASDDFELLLAAKFKGVESAFLDELAGTYKDGLFPPVK